MDIYLFYLAYIICNLPKCTQAVVSLQEQLDHVANRVLESRLGRRSSGPVVSDPPSRRSAFSFDVNNAVGIVGAPSMPNHLPEAEPILPGHTLIRPAMGMLKSSIKFPHREMEDGFGVDGNINNLGIRFDGRNERVLYSGFRRMPSDYFMVVPNKQEIRKGEPSFDISSIVIDMDEKRKVRNKILEKLRLLKKPAKKKLIIYLMEPEDAYVSKERKSIQKDHVKDKLTSNNNKYLSRRRNNYIKKNFNSTKETGHQLNTTKQENMVLKNELQIVRRENKHIQKLLKYMATNGLKDQFKKYHEILYKAQQKKRIKPDALTNRMKKTFQREPPEDSTEQIISTVFSSHESTEEYQKTNQKLTWLLGTKNQFDNIKFEDDAPDFEEFVIKEPRNDFLEDVESNDGKKQWWFFNQHDWKEPENGDEKIFQNPIYA